MQSEPIWKTLESVDFNIDKKEINEWTFPKLTIALCLWRGDVVQWKDVSCGKLSGILSFSSSVVVLVLSLSVSIFKMEQVIYPIPKL